MNVFENLDIPEILKFGVIGLGFLLALLSFYLLRIEQKKDEHDKIVINSIRLFMLFSIIVLLIGLFSEFIKTPERLSIQLGRNELQVREIKTVPASDINPGKYFVSSEQKFAFRLPNKKNWSQITKYTGVVGLFKLMEIDSDVISLESLVEGVMNNPLGTVISNMSLYYFENQASRTKISLTDSSSNKMIDYYMETAGRQLLDPASPEYLDTTVAKNKTAYKEKMKRYRETLFGFRSFVAKESFLLYVLPKARLVENLKDMSMPAFFVSFSSFLGYNVDKLVANESQILIGSEIKMRNLDIGDNYGNFQNKKWMMFAENDQYFYVIEINYSPQITDSIDLWDELQSYLQSFVMLSD